MKDDLNPPNAGQSLAKAWIVPHVRLSETSSRRAPIGSARRTMFAGRSKIKFSAQRTDTRFMEHAWFLYSDNTVTGPFTTDQVRGRVQTGEIGSGWFIWWKGQREWLPVSTWNESLGIILAALASTVEKPIWYVDAGNARTGRSALGPLTQKEMVDNLRSMAEISRVRLWAVGMDHWQSVYELHQVMEYLGISRREHDRAPLMGEASVTRSNEDPRGYFLRTASIGIGGIGVAGAFGLRRGDELKILLRSKDLSEVLHFHGEVVYVTGAGYAGIRFIKPSAEAVAVIHEYVKLFAHEAKDANDANRLRRIRSAA